MLHQQGRCWVFSGKKSRQCSVSDDKSVKQHWTASGPRVNRQRGTTASRMWRKHTTLTLLFVWRLNNKPQLIDAKLNKKKKSNNKKQMPSRWSVPCLGLFFSAVQQMALMPNDWLSYVLMHVEGAMAESNPWGGWGTGTWCMFGFGAYECDSALNTAAMPWDSKHTRIPRQLAHKHVNKVQKGSANSKKNPLLL